MNRIAIGPEGQFSLEGENFVIDVSVKGRRQSTSEAFTIVKNEPYLRVYDDLASGFSPRSILELGIFQGGSYVFLDKLFKPRRMSAVEIGPQPVALLLRYVAGMENRFVHFSTSQCDREILEQIVRKELADQLDLVVDDASHTYEGTKASFDDRHVSSVVVNVPFDKLLKNRSPNRPKSFYELGPDLRKKILKLNERDVYTYVDGLPRFRRLCDQVGI